MQHVDAAMAFDGVGHQRPAIVLHGDVGLHGVGIEPLGPDQPLRLVQRRQAAAGQRTTVTPRGREGDAAVARPLLMAPALLPGADDDRDLACEPHRIPS
ncbi:MAG: hypothetical protein R2749_18560 [Acidimicrobiales bacterium]